MKGQAVPSVRLSVDTLHKVLLLPGLGQVQLCCSELPNWRRGHEVVSWAPHPAQSLSASSHTWQNLAFAVSAPPCRISSAPAGHHLPCLSR